MCYKSALKCIIATIVLLAAHAPMAAADIYTWVDDQGVHHFSNQPPPDASFEVRLFVSAAPYVRPPELPTVVGPASQVETAVTDLIREVVEPPSTLESGPLATAALAESAEYQANETPMSPPFLSQSSSQASHREVVVIRRYRHRVPSYQDHRRLLRHRFPGYHKRSKRHKDSERIAERHLKPHIRGRHSSSRLHPKPTAFSHFDNGRHRWLPMLMPPAKRHPPSARRHHPHRTRTVEGR